MRSFILTFVVFTSGLVLAQALSKKNDAAQTTISGSWNGVHKIQERTLHFVLHITGTGENLSATADSPDECRYGMPVDRVALDNQILHFTIAKSNVEFTGTFSGGSISGVMKQHKANVCELFERIRELTGQLLVCRHALPESCFGTPMLKRQKTKKLKAARARSNVPRPRYSDHHGQLMYLGATMARTETDRGLTDQSSRCCRCLCGVIRVAIGYGLERNAADRDFLESSRLLEVSPHKSPHKCKRTVLWVCRK